MSGITDPTEAYFKDGQWGWDGTQWRKLPLAWGFSERYGEKEAADNVAAGLQELTFSTVPAGEVWMIETFSAFCAQADPSLIFLIANCGGVDLFLKSEAYPTANITVCMTTRIVLAHNDYLKVAFHYCVLNNDIRAHANGYKMKIAE